MAPVGLLAANPWIIPAASAVLGGLSKKGKKKTKTTSSYTNQVNPASQLGGWDAINASLQRLGTGQQHYVPGANNPYLAGGMQHIFERAGIPTPEGGYPNPYLQAHPPQMADAGPAPTPQPTPTPKPPTGIGGAVRQRNRIMRQIP